MRRRRRRDFRWKQIEGLEQGGVDRIRSGMEKLRAHVDGEVMSVELDVERLDVPANSVATLEEHDIALPVEQPRHRHARHAAADDRDRAPRRRRMRQHWRTRCRGNRFEHITARPGCGHGISSAIFGANL